MLARVYPPLTVVRPQQRGRPARPVASRLCAACLSRRGCTQVLKELECCGSKKCFSGRGVSGVPHFIIAGKYHLSGAQETDTLVQIFGKLATEH